MNEPCKTIRPLLVDYSDGVLPDNRAASIAAHLAGCASCRAELRLLEESLSLAREVWEGAARGQKCVPPRPLGEDQIASPRPLGEGPGARARQKAFLAGGLALCATIVLVAIGLSLLSSGIPSPVTKKSNLPPLNDVTPIPGIAKEVDAMEYIAREGRAARLAASMQMLATEPNLKAYKDNAERYLRENYADTTAVKMLGQQ